MNAGLSASLQPVPQGPRPLPPASHHLVHACPCDGHALTWKEPSGMAFGRCTHCLGMWIRRSYLGDKLVAALSSHDGTADFFRATGKPRGHCPDCRSNQLLARKVHSVEVDVCPHCQGVWFDPGELRKLQAAIVALTPAAQAAQSRSETPTWPDVADLGDLLLGLAETAPELAGKMILAVFEVILS